MFYHLYLTVCNQFATVIVLLYDKKDTKPTAFSTINKTRWLACRQWMVYIWQHTPLTSSFQQPITRPGRRARLMSSP